MDATLGGARSQLPVHSKAFAGGAQERQQQNGKGVEEQEAVAATAQGLTNPLILDDPESAGESRALA